MRSRISELPASGNQGDDIGIIIAGERFKAVRECIVAEAQSSAVACSVSLELQVELLLKRTEAEGCVISSGSQHSGVDPLCFEQRLAAPAISAQQPDTDVADDFEGSVKWCVTGDLQFNELEMSVGALVDEIDRPAPFRRWQKNA